MEQEFEELKKYFDLELDKIRNSTIYQEYQNSKEILDQCTESTNLLANIKQLQKINVNTTDIALKSEIETELNNLNKKYDELFEVSQFRIAYENLLEKVSLIKNEIENSINK